MLNIEGLPVYRDQKGGVGTPTSDNERTKIDISTTHVLILVNGYDGNKETVGANAEFLKSLLERYAAASDVTIHTY
jgi:DNA/RNA-binding domain of Phe-tRNA-synthetase-like protein